MKKIIRLFAAVAAVAALAGGVFAVSQPAEAGVNAFGVTISTSSGSVTVGSTFVITTGVTTTGAAYSAVQHQVAYDDTLVQFQSAAVAAGPPAGFCTAAPTATQPQLDGCLDFAATLSGTSTITYSGPVWATTYTCIAPGTTNFTFTNTDPATPPVKTFVKDVTTNEPINVGAPVSVTCTGTALPPTSTPVPAATNTPNPAATNTTVAAATNTSVASGTKSPFPPKTATPTASSTSAAGETPVPVATTAPGGGGTTPPGGGGGGAQATATRVGGGVGAGGIGPPNTGSGPMMGDHYMWLWVALGIGLLGSGAGYVGWRERRRLHR